MKSTFLVLAVFFVYAPAIFADWATIPSRSFEMAPPPARGSDEFKNDYAVLLRHQENRSDDDCELSLRQNFPNFESLYGSSKLLSRAEARVVEPLVSRAMNISLRVSTFFKDKFNRPRPYNVDARIQPCVHKPVGSKAYPSSHASMAATGACLLAKLFPQRENRILNYGEYLGDLRVIVGVHHPSDVAAGKKIGHEVCARLQNDPAFQVDFAETQNNLP